MFRRNGSDDRFFRRDMSQTAHVATLQTIGVPQDPQLTYASLRGISLEMGP
jgi:hypothetical protein